MRVQPLRVIDNDFNLLTEIDDYASLQWTRRWHKPGDFELHMSASAQGAMHLQKGVLVLLAGKAGLVLHREIHLNDNGTEELVVKGASLASVVGRRITLPPDGSAYDRLTAETESIMKHFVDVNCVNPIDERRRIDRLSTGPDQQRCARITYQSRLKALDEELEKLSIGSGLGWDVVLDQPNRSWVFEVYTGRDLRAGQIESPPVIFAADFDAVRSQVFTDSDIGHRNQAYVGGQGEGADRAIVEVGDGKTGLERIETFIDAHDLGDAADLPARGSQKLLEMAQVSSFATEILPNGPFIYGADWDLGDIVTVQNRKWGITSDVRVTEVMEIHEPSGLRIDVTFGSNMPTLVEKVKQAVDGPLIEKSTLSSENIPTMTSQLENDSGFVTADQIPQAATYTHQQMVPSNVWTISHGLGRYPSVTAVDSAGTVVIGDVTYLSDQTVQITFSAPFSGRAYLN